MKTSELYELLRQYELRTASLKANAAVVKFEIEVARKLGYYVDWNSMVKH